VPPETLLLSSLVELEVELEVAEMYWDFGDGYGRQAFVGHTSGQSFYRLKFMLPDRSTHTVSNPETMATETYVDYIFNFWLARKVDGEAFNITDPRTLSTVSVDFVDRKLTAPMIGKRLFNTGLRFRQRRT